MGNAGLDGLSVKCYYDRLPGFDLVIQKMGNSTTTPVRAWLADFGQPKKAGGAKGQFGIYTCEARVVSDHHRSFSHAGLILAWSPIRSSQACVRYEIER